METLKKFIWNQWFHILIWAVIAANFVFVPDLVAYFMTSSGRPLRVNDPLPVESDKITLRVDGFNSVVKDGEQLFTLYGWAFMMPDENQSPGEFVREVVLVSDKNIYFFSVESVVRDPGSQIDTKDLAVNLEELGFKAFISADIIRPGKYRVGIVFKDKSSGAAYFWDKPVHYIIRTPNTISLQD